jgi:hypothetical protein
LPWASAEYKAPPYAEPIPFHPVPPTPWWHYQCPHLKREGRREEKREEERGKRGKQRMRNRRRHPSSPGGEDTGLPLLRHKTALHGFTATWHQLTLHRYPFAIATYGELTASPRSPPIAFGMVPPHLFLSQGTNTCAHTPWTRKGQRRATARSRTLVAHANAERTRHG